LDIGQPEPQAGKETSSGQNHGSVEKISEPVPFSSRSEISDTIKVPNPISVKDSDPTTPKLSLPPYIDNSNNIALFHNLLDTFVHADFGK
jgi:hypothetical protein